MITLYNWYELNSISELPEAHIALIFALRIGTSKRLSANLDLLKAKLHVTKLSNRLFSLNIFGYYGTGVFSHYETQEPQSYIRNCSFVHTRFSARDKADYIHILSQRSIANKNNWIPAYYVDKKYHTNPLITKIDNKITFPLETNYGKRLDTTEKTTSTREFPGYRAPET